MCVFEGSAINVLSNETVDFALSTSSTDTDAGWPCSQFIYGSGAFHTTRILTVTNLTTTIYPLVWVSDNTNNAGIMYYTLQCVRIA